MWISWDLKNTRGAFWYYPQFVFVYMFPDRWRGLENDLRVDLSILCFVLLGWIRTEISPCNIIANKCDYILLSIYEALVIFHPGFPFSPLPIYFLSPPFFIISSSLLPSYLLLLSHFPIFSSYSPLPPSSSPSAPLISFLSLPFIYYIFLSHFTLPPFPS